MAHTRLLLMSPASVEGLIPLISVFWKVISIGGPLSVTVLYKSLCTSCPYSCQKNISEQHCALVNFVCVRACVCPPVLSIMGWTAAASVWRQATSERKCIHIYHQLWPVSAVNNIYSIHQYAQYTRMHTYHIFPLLCVATLALGFVTMSI